MAAFAQARIQRSTNLLVLVAMGAGKVIQSNRKVVQVCAMTRLNSIDERLRTEALLFCAKHDGRAVLVVAAYINDLVTAHFLKTRP